MKTLKQKFAAVLLISLVSLASAMSAVPVYAAGASISLIGNKSTVAAGGSYVVAVYMNGGGTAINGVEADFTYPASTMQYVGISYAGSAFGIVPGGNGGGNGSVNIAVGTISPVSGSALVATVTFRALGNSGTASFDVSSSSSLVNANDNTAVSYGTAGDSVKFGVAAAAPTNAGSARAPAAPAAPAIPEPPKDTSAPIISGLKVKSMTPYSAIIVWMTNEPADTSLDYGLDSNYGLSASQASPTTTHELNLSSSFLTPKSLIHYRVKGADAAGNIVTGSDKTLQLPGVALTVVVRGNDGQPQAGALVTVDNQTEVTNAQGSVNLQSSLGSKQVVITYGGVTVRRPITVIRSIKPLPAYRLDLAKQPLNHWMVTSIGLMVVVLTLLGLDAVLFGSTFATKLVHWRHRGSARSGPVAEPALVPVDAPLTTAAPTQQPTPDADVERLKSPVKPTASHSKKVVVHTK
jgi:hypothetical protein